MAKLHLTVEAVKELPFTDAGQALYTDTKLTGFGLRVGVRKKTFIVERRVNGAPVRVTLGEYPLLTVAQARAQAIARLGELAGGRNPNAEKKAAEAARTEQEVADAHAAKYTLQALCEAYVAYLKAKDKSSWQDAQNLFKLYVWGDHKRPASEFAALPARELTIEQAADLTRVPWEAGKQRTAAKLRSYLRAAYALAQLARTDSSKPQDLKPFRIDVNPIAGTGSLSEANKQRHTVLTAEELGESMRLLAERRSAGYDDALAAIELSIVLGGQRLAQVLRIAPADVDLEAGTVTLWDGKGRRKEARKHVLPVPKAARPLVEMILAHRRGTAWVFGDKRVPTSPETVSVKGGELLRAAQENVATKAGRPPQLRAIQPRDFRRTSETLMAGMGISKDLRAQLQSHGLGGVQDRHYDQHDYIAEKRKALESWNRKLQALADGKPAPSNVKALKRA